MENPIKKEHLVALGAGTRRFGIVVYGLIAVITAISVFAGSYNFDGKLALALLFAGGFGLGTLIGLEIARRLLLFIITGEKIFNKNFPTICKVLAGLFVCAAVIGGLLYFFVQLPGERKAERLEYEAAKSALPEAEALAEACVSQKTSSPEEPVESAYCRSTRLDYNACREYASHTFCISLHDYESACKPSGFLSQLQTYSLSSAEYTCYADVRTKKNIISAYEDKYVN